jgi:hypothetical protein
MAKINVQQTDVTILQINDADYISLTDMANAKDCKSAPADVKIVTYTEEQEFFYAPIFILLHKLNLIQPCNDEIF